jgi:hypothetical protein
MLYKRFPLNIIQGVYIDIVPVTGFPADDDEIRYRYEWVGFLDAQWYAYYFSKGIDGIAQVDNRAELWDKKYDMPFETSPNICEAQEYFRFVLSRDAFDYGTTLEFEGERYSAMKGWQEYLDRRYAKLKGKTQEEIGESQVPHPIKAYWKGQQNGE